MKDDNDDGKEEKAVAQRQRMNSMCGSGLYGYTADCQREKEGEKKQQQKNARAPTYKHTIIPKTYRDKKMGEKGNVLCPKRRKKKQQQRENREKREDRRQKKEQANKMETIMMYCNKNNNNLYLKRRWSSMCECECVFIMGLMAIRAQLVTQGTDRQYNEKTVEPK